jgi:signal transduction histidine kinase
LITELNQVITESKDLFFKAKSGARIPVSIVGSLVKDANSRFLGIALVVRDITNRIEMEEALTQAKITAETSDKSKSNFLANMSHEIRTPLNAIIGFAEILDQGLAGTLSPEQKDLLKDILSSGGYLLSLINDILYLAKVEAGQMELALARFSLRDMLEHSLTLVREKASVHGLQLHLDVPPDIAEIVADERKVKQVMYNLLSNAVKFTPAGGAITISAETIPGTADALPLVLQGALPQKSWILIHVRDTGIGIPAEENDKIFRTFSQIANPYSKSAQGTGLGLALSKQIVVLHRGRIWYESAGTGKGTTFSFALPYSDNLREK